MTTPFRTIAGGIALAAGLWYLSAINAAPPLSKDTYKKAVDAEITFIKDALKGGSPDKRAVPTIKASAIVLAVYAEATGDATLQAQAIKVAEAVAKKDFAGADAAAKELTAKPGSTPLKGKELHKHAKLGLEEVMSPFRGGKVGGQNIEKDIRDMMNGKVKIDPAALEVLAARTAIIGELSTKFPNEKAETNEANKADWARWSKDMIDAGKKLSDEAAKGKGANEKEIVKLLKGLDAKCSDCHNKFRD